MFSYVLSSATTYFHLPIDDEDPYIEDEDPLSHSPYPKHISWRDDATDSDDSDPPTPPSPFPSSSSSSFSSRNGKAKAGPTPPPRSRAVISEILAQNDLYAILGLSRSSRLEKGTLRRAYLSRSRACHPDKFSDNPEATHAFQKVSVAYDILSKPSSKRVYDARSANAAFDYFASRPQADETFRSVVIGVFNDMLDGDLEMIRTLLSAVNDLNPSLRLGEDGINAVLMTLQSIRARALTCRTCILALHSELTHLLELQRAFRELSFFDLRGRSHLTLQIARLTVRLPLAIEDAIQQEKMYEASFESDSTSSGGRPTDPGTALLNRRVYLLLQSLVTVLERMERIVG